MPHSPAPRRRPNIAITVDEGGPTFHWTDRPRGAYPEEIVVPTMGEARRVAMLLCIEERERWAAHTRFCHASTLRDVSPANLSGRDPLTEVPEASPQGTVGTTPT